MTTSPASLYVFRGDELLLGEDGSLLPLAARESLLGADAPAHRLDELGGAHDAAASVDKGFEPPTGLRFTKLRALFGAWDDERFAVAGKAFQIAEWVRTHRFCGVCGGPMQRVAHERSFRCARCGFVAYPRISPVMMVLIRRDDAILLARHVAYATQRFSALAGFVEAGETVEQAIHREVREEVGLEVGELRYFGSQSWPFPHSLMIAFTAEYAGGTLRPDGTEIAEARWVEPGMPLPDIPPVASIAGRLIRANLRHGATG